MAETEEQFEAVQEGSRWRYARPSPDELAAWFKEQPLHEGMKHEDYIGGIILIASNEKVKVQHELGTGERWETVYTPYARVDTRIRYFRAYARLRGEIALIEPVELHFETSMPTGFWMFSVKDRNYVCCTSRVALYDRRDWFAERGVPATLEGQGTKQVPADPMDENSLAKAETGSIGRALGVAGMLTLNSGIASAEDMQELAPPVLASELATLPSDDAQIASTLLELEAKMREDHPAGWAEFTQWWRERSKQEGWRKVSEAPIEVRRGMIKRMRGMLAEAPPKTESEPDGDAPAL